MKFDVNTVLKNLNGEVLKDSDGKGNVIEATVKLAIVNALLAPTQKQESGVEKMKKWELAKKVYGGGQVDLNEQEITLIKDCVATVYPSAQIVGLIWDFLKI